MSKIPYFTEKYDKDSECICKTCRGRNMGIGDCDQCGQQRNLMYIFARREYRYQLLPILKKVFSETLEGINKTKGTDIHSRHIITAKKDIFIYLKTKILDEIDVDK